MTETRATVIASAGACIPVLFFLAVVWWVTSQYSPRPEPAAHEQRAGGNDQTAADDAGAGAIPSVFDFFYPSGIEAISRYCAAKPKGEPDKWLHEKFICDVHSTDVLIAGFTGLLFIATGALWYSTRRLVNTHDKAARRELRAHFLPMEAVIQEDFSFAVETQREPIAEATVSLKNTGRTPAYDVRIIGGMCIRPYDRDGGMRPESLDLELLRYPETGIAKATFGPEAGRLKSERMKGPANTERAHKSATLDEARDVESGASTVFVYGEIQYRDEFNAKRWTTYCYIWNRNVKELRRDKLFMATFQAWNETGVQGKRGNDGKPQFCKLSEWLGAHDAPLSV